MKDKELRATVEALDKKLTELYEILDISPAYSSWLLGRYFPISKGKRAPVPYEEFKQLLEHLNLRFEKLPKVDEKTVVVSTVLPQGKPANK